MRIIRDLFPSHVHVAEMPPAREAIASITPLELNSIRQALIKRQIEFATSRALARMIFARLDVSPEFSLLNGPDRAPIWPAGTTGSITHTNTWVAVAVGHSDEVSSLGCDVEAASAIDPLAMRTICSDEEIRRWDKLDGAISRLAGVIAFSAKESIYKAQYPLTKSFIEFHEIDIFLVQDANRFIGILLKDAAPFSRGDVFRGLFAVRDGLVATTMLLDVCGTETGQ